MKILVRSLVATLFVFSMAACGGDDDGGTPDSTPSGPDASTGPMVTASASPTDVTAGGDTMVTVTATNFNLVDPATHTTDMAGEGHYHIYLDQDTTYLVADFQSPVTITIPPGTALGAHTLKVELFTNTHGELTPPVFTTVDINVQ